jgi:capsular polysaccharide biosynthesis protein
MRFSAPRPLRRAAVALVSRGPWRLAPFAHIARKRAELGGPVDGPECFTGELPLLPPELVHYDLPPSLLGQKPATEPSGRRGFRYRDRGFWPHPGTSLFSLCDAGVATNEGIVYCPISRHAVAETVRSWTQARTSHPLLASPRFPPAEELPGVTLSLLTLSGEGFYHFFLEALPRLAALRGQFDRIDRILVNGNPGEYQQQWLEHAGVPAAKLRFAHPQLHFRCEQLLFSGPAMADCRPTRGVVEALRGICRHVAGSPQRWLWISRAGYTQRDVTWERAWLARFPRFESVTLAALPPAGQIARFREAAVVAGPHGAGLATLVFAPPGVRVFELFPDLHVKPNFWRLTRVADGVATWAATDFSVPRDLAALAAAFESFVSRPASAPAP